MNSATLTCDEQEQKEKATLAARPIKTFDVCFQCSKDYNVSAPNSSREICVSRKGLWYPICTSFSLNGKKHGGIGWGVQKTCPFNFEHIMFKKNSCNILLHNDWLWIRHQISQGNALIKDQMRLIPIHPTILEKDEVRHRFVNAIFNERYSFKEHINSNDLRLKSLENFHAQRHVQLSLKCHIEQIKKDLQK